MAGFDHYDIKALTLLIGGVKLHGVGGPGENFLKVRPSGDSFGDEVGADGHVTRYAIHDGRSDVEVECMESSAINDRLMALHKLDASTPNGAAVGGFLAKDAYGRYLIDSPEAWVKKLPDTDRGSKPGMVTWAIRLSNIRDGSIIGGRG